ncbi:hypothetical protein GCM10022222_69230 [Amycolatopsis ultiminotia]|uniref:Uncharacterized protein n=1 Tax=Amycolatopsis ultiminotia TaxID=543629 RepID=A0ABP6Y0F1_9PSEU
MRKPGGTTRPATPGQAGSTRIGHTEVINFRPPRLQLRHRRDARIPAIAEHLHRPDSPTGDAQSHPIPATSPDTSQPDSPEPRRFAPSRRGTPIPGTPGTRIPPARHTPPSRILRTTGPQHTDSPAPSTRIRTVPIPTPPFFD